MLRLVGWLVLGVVLMTVVAAGVQPSPRMSDLPWVPGGLGRWADLPWLMHGRHWLAFMGLTWLALEMVGWEVRLAEKRGTALSATLLGYRWSIVLAVATLVLLIEAVQLALPDRSADLPDLVCGLVGVAMGQFGQGRVRLKKGYV